MFFDPDFIDNPYPRYRQLLAGGPIHHIDLFGGAWAFPRHADVTALLRDPRLSARRSSALVDQFPEEEREEFGEFQRIFSMWMLFFDAPEHTRPRKVLSRAFAPEALRGIGAKIQKVVNELLDATEADGRMDFIRDFAHPLPAVVIAELLGVPAGDRGRFISWSDDIADFFGGTMTHEAARRAQRGLVALTDYFKASVEERRRRPGDDLISVLIQLEEQDCALTEEELCAQCAMLLFAGHETTRNLLGNGLLALLRHPEQLRLLRQDPMLARTAVDEFLRYDSPVQFGTRVAAQDLELYGREVKRGELLILLLGAANHDPLEFEEPHRLDITRKPNRHVSFGYGPHSCVGAYLARLEGEIAFNTLLGRLPEVGFGESPLVRASNFGFRGLKSLPISFGPPARTSLSGAHVAPVCLRS